MLATKMEIKTVQIRIKTTNLRLRIFSSYLTAVGSGSSQYQWMVFLPKSFLTAKEEEQLKLSNKLRNGQLKNFYTLGWVHTGWVQYAPSRVDGHVLRVLWATHLTVTF